MTTHEPGPEVCDPPTPQGPTHRMMVQNKRKIHPPSLLQPRKHLPRRCGSGPVALETNIKRAYLCLLRGQPGPVWNLDEPHVVQVVLMLPAPLQAVVQEVGHAPKDPDPRLQLQKANIKGQLARRDRAAAAWPRPHLGLRAVNLDGVAELDHVRESGLC